MELSNLISTDNIYKFGFMGGIVMLFFAIIYPMKLTYEIEIERSKINYEIQLLNFETEHLLDQVNSFKNDTNGVSISEFKKLKSLKYNFSQDTIKINTLQDNLLIKKKQRKTYSFLSWFLGVIGFILMIISGVFWIWSTKRDEKIKTINIEKLENE